MTIESGFTVLEVLVALAIALPAVLLLYRQGIQAIDTGRTAAAYQEAISRAQSRLEATAAGVLAESERSGADGGGYRWRASILKLGAFDPPRSGGQPGVRVELYAIRIDIVWGEGAGRQLTLNSRRLVERPQ